jgi:RNA polymerase sigma-70 factor (sigma-E family)
VSLWGGVIEEEARASEGLRAAFDLHYAALMRLCLALGDQDGDAADVVQEAFARAAPSLERLKPEVVRSYLRRTVMNLRHDRGREAARSRDVPAPAPIPDPAPAIDDREVLWAALGDLPDRQRACLVLRFYEDLSEREVASLLGCSRRSVKSHTHRGLKQLRKDIER